MFDLNHLAVEVQIKGHNSPIPVKVKDEMIVQVNFKKGMMMDSGEALTRGTNDLLMNEWQNNL